jgi:hypothetical protein
MNYEAEPTDWGKFISAVVMLPFKVLSKLLPLLLNKGGLLIVGGIIALVFLANVGKGNDTPERPKQVELTIPESQAPTMITAGTWTYLVGQYHSDNESVTMDRFWYYNSDKEIWVPATTPLTLDRSKYHGIAIQKR